LDETEIACGLWRKFKAFATRVVAKTRAALRPISRYFWVIILQAAAAKYAAPETDQDIDAERPTWTKAKCNLSKYELKTLHKHVVANDMPTLSK
jgi:hypothetical protein